MKITTIEYKGGKGFITNMNKLLKVKFFKINKVYSIYI